MAQEVTHLSGCQRRALGEMLFHTPGLVLKREGAGQMVECVLANQVDQVLGRIELGRVRRGVQERQVDVFQSCPGVGFGDFSQQFADGGLHGIPVDGGIVEDGGDPVVSHLGIAQHQQDDHHGRIVGFAFLAETDMRRALLNVHVEEAVQFCAVVRSSPGTVGAVFFGAQA